VTELVTKTAAGHLRDEKWVLLALTKMTADGISMGDDMADLVKRLRCSGVARSHVRCKPVLLPHDECPVAAVHLKTREGEAASGGLAKGPCEISGQVLGHRIVDFVGLTAVVVVLMRIPDFGDTRQFRQSAATCLGGPSEGSWL